jgi:alpha/beta superfamily hydrolase
VEERAETVAKRAVERAQIIVPLLVGALGIFGTFIGTQLASTRANEARFAKLESTCASTQQLQAREAKLETLLPLKQHMDALEMTKVRDLTERVQRLETASKR